MLTSNFFKKIFLLFLIVFFSIPLLKIHADVTPVSLISPTDNAETVTTLSTPAGGANDYKFKFTFTVPLVTGTLTPPNDVDAIVFEGAADNAKPGFQYIWNQKKVDWQGQTTTASWNVDLTKIPIPIGSKSFTWSLYDYNTKKSYVDNQNFSFKDDPSYKGCYFISKIKSETSEEFIYSTSSRYVAEENCSPSCTNGWADYIKSHPTATSYTTPTCKQYDTLPTTPVNEKINPTDPKTNYTLLEPLPDGSGQDMKSFESDPGCTTDSNGKKTCKNPCAFAKYLNIIIKLFLGISAVLAVVMIIYGGIEYMTSVIPSEKGSGKGTIMNAILGLVIALGAYLLLYTINPNLANVCLDQQLPPVEITIQDDVETPDTAQIDVVSSIPTGPTIGCKDGLTGIVTSGGSFYVCKDKTFSIRLKTMVDKAWSQGIKLSGGSFRTKSQQEALRAKNCGGSSNIYVRSASCHPKTAYPGTSRHENGLAVDFQCNGVLISSSTNSCYAWLKSNANSFGFFNLSGEPWHWSVDGR